MAFGGVATGSINAHDAATVIPTIKMNGWISKESATGTIIGNSIAVVAKFEVISVKKLTMNTTTSNNTINGKPSIKVT